MTTKRGVAMVSGTRLRELAVPTLVVAGAHDLPDVQAIADLFGARIPGARTLTLPAARHMASSDAPAAFNRAVLDFLAAVDFSASRPAPGNTAGRMPNSSGGDRPFDFKDGELCTSGNPLELPLICGKDISRGDLRWRLCQQ